MKKLSQEVEHQLIGSIKRFFREQLEDDIGELKAKLLLDYCLKEIAPIVYNQAIADAQSFLEDKLEDLSGSCYEPEMGYWRK